ncbi:MAG: guanylate kinase [Thermodesulfobacteriota bacterium]|nr:guanylate kinase [Thermodesulfobacteriota bacterium]
MDKEGLIFIISAPSGAGKTSLCKEVARVFPDLWHSVSYTTRSPRLGENDGYDYYFVSEGKFKEMVDARKFAEWSEIYGDRYGTPVDALKKYKSNGIDIILDIDGKGATQLRGSYPKCIYIFILPPSWEDLKKRLRARMTNTEEEIKERLKSTKEELQYVVDYDYIVVNNDFETAVSQLVSIITAERCRKERVLHKVEELLNS